MRRACSGSSGISVAEAVEARQMLEDSRYALLEGGGPQSDGLLLRSDLRQERNERYSTSAFNGMLDGCSRLATR
jgi:hypothetical protein